MRKLRSIPEYVAASKCWLTSNTIIQMSSLHQRTPDGEVIPCDFCQYTPEEKTAMLKECKAWIDYNSGAPARNFENLSHGEQRRQVLRAQYPGDDSALVQ